LLIVVILPLFDFKENKPFSQFSFKWQPTVVQLYAAQITPFHAVSNLFPNQITHFGGIKIL